MQLLMAHFAVRIEAPVCALEAWERVLDLQRQEEIIPFTTVRRSPPPGKDAPAEDAPTGDTLTGDVPLGVVLVGEAPVGGMPAGDAPAADDAGDHPGPSGARNLQVGTRFFGRTALGPVGFDDPMVVEVLRAPSLGVPGFARIRKEGSVVRGWIDLVVADEPAGPSEPRSRVTWSQVISVRWVPRWLDPLVAIVARAAYGLALRRLVQGD
jgi:hypothetical protein